MMRFEALMGIQRAKRMDPEEKDLDNSTTISVNVAADGSAVRVTVGDTRRVFSTEPVVQQESFAPNSNFVAGMSVSSELTRLIEEMRRKVRQSNDAEGDRVAISGLGYEFRLADARCLLGLLEAANGRSADIKKA